MSKKFKIGDRVRYMSGVIGTIDAINHDKTGDYWHIHVEKGSDFWLLNPNHATKIEQDKIVILRDGMKTIATHYHDGEKVSTGVAKCNPKEDEYDFKCGVDIAVERMFENERKAEVKSDLPTGDFVCIEGVNPWWEVGRVYHFENGTTHDSDGDVRCFDCGIFTSSDGKIILGMRTVVFVPLKR